MRQMNHQSQQNMTKMIHHIQFQVMMNLPHYPRILHRNQKLRQRRKLNKNLLHHIVNHMKRNRKRKKLKRKRAHLLMILLVQMKIHHYPLNPLQKRKLTNNKHKILSKMV